MTEDSNAIELMIEANFRDLGGFSVRRVLPNIRKRLVGPFIFFDHMGPAHFTPGVGLDVRPHPHIALATVTFLFEGEIIHRDSLGSLQAIRPGDVNWMVAGRGIVHSERSSEQARSEGLHVHGVQSWVALPLEHEEVDPSFEHHPASSIPRIERNGVQLDVIAGTAYGERSPVTVLSPTLYVHAKLDADARLVIDAEHEQRAAYVVEGAARCEGRSLSAGSMIVLRSGHTPTIEADAPARVMLVGGSALAGERIVWWNFVSSSQARIDRAKEDWKNGRFPKVPGDDVEFIPLPEP